MMNKTIRDHITFEYKGKDVKFPMILFSALSLAKRRVDLKLDNFWLISGAVGSGKSTIAQGIAGIYQILFNRELSMNNFTWRADGIVEFTDQPENETQVIIQDEGIIGMTGRDGLTKSGQQLKICLVTKRRMRIFYLILIDEIQEYSQKVINRATLLLDTRFIMNKGEPTRGFFKIYNKKEIKEIYWLLKEKKIRGIEEYKARAKPFYTFYNYEDIFVSEKDYEDKKIEETNQSDESTNINWSSKKVKAFYLWASTNKKLVDIADIVGVSRTTMTPWKRDFLKYEAKETI